MHLVQMNTGATSHSCPCTPGRAALGIEHATIFRTASADATATRHATEWPILQSTTVCSSAVSSSCRQRLAHPLYSIDTSDQRLPHSLHSFSSSDQRLAHPLNTIGL